MNKPLCVDCDGTLIATDLLYEAFFLLLKQYPLGLFLLPFWLLKGKVYLKERLAEHVTFNWETLPYRPEVMSMIEKAREQGRQVVQANRPCPRSTPAPFHRSLLHGSHKLCPHCVGETSTI